MRVRRVWCWHFTGLARRTGLSIRETYAYFARHRINVVFLADNSQVMYLNGVESLGGTFEQTLEKLRTLIGEWGITDLFTFGNSAGGYGAMLYGAHLGAHPTLSIAGPSRLDPEFEPRVVSFSRVEVLQEVRKTRSLDLAHVLPPLAPLPRIDCYYALDCAEDVAQAQNIVHLSSVTLHPMPSGGHAVILATDKTGDWQKVAGEFFFSGHQNEPVPRALPASLRMRVFPAAFSIVIEQMIGKLEALASRRERLWRLAFVGAGPMFPVE